MTNRNPCNQIKVYLKLYYKFFGLKINQLNSLIPFANNN